MGNKHEQAKGKGAGWNKFLHEGENVKEETDVEEKRVVQSCGSGSGRTGSFLASLDQEKLY